MAVALVSGVQFAGNDFGRTFEGRAWTCVCGHDGEVIFRKSTLDMLNTDGTTESIDGSPSATSSRPRPHPFHFRRHRQRVRLSKLQSTAFVGATVAVACCKWAWDCRASVRVNAIAGRRDLAMVVEGTGRCHLCCFSWFESSTRWIQC